MNIYFIIWFIIWPFAKGALVVLMPWIFRDDEKKLAEINDAPGIYWAMGAIWPLFMVAFLYDYSMGFIKSCCREIKKD